MIAEERYISRILFKNKIHKANGQKFENILKVVKELLASSNYHYATIVNQNQLNMTFGMNENIIKS